MLRFRSERGIALVMALGLLTVLTISGTAVTYYATTNLTDSSSHKARASAYDLAEAGINDAIATMSNQLDSAGALKTIAGTWKKPTDPTLLSTPVTVSYPTLKGSVTYSGALTISGTNYIWRITSTGKVKNGNNGYQTKTLYKNVKVLGTNSAGGSSWSRFYDDSTSQCLNIDNQTFVTNVATRGNLCLSNGGAITGAGVTVDVGGTVTITGPDATSPTKPPALGAGWPTTPTNIYTSNSAYAQNTIAAGATGSNEDATNFGFTVPATAVVEGITATVQRLASSCCNAVQTITETGSPTGGTFKLNATQPGGASTATVAIAYNASAATVQAALVTIFTNGTVTCTGGSLPATAVVCTFSGSAGNQPIVLMTKNSGTALTGGSSPSVSVAMTTAGSVGAIQDATVQLLKAGAPVGNNKASATTWGTTSSTITYGTSADLWGLSTGALTGADVDASNFGLRFAAKNVAAASATASVDYITITITYKPDAPGIGTSSVPVGATQIGGTCTYLLQSAHTPCTSVDHVYSNPVPVTTAAASNPALVMPKVDYNYWWANAAPGPKHFCTNSNPGLSATFFDNNAGTTTGPDASITINGEMAPDNADYTCQVVTNGVLQGELSWNHTTHVMTIDGVIFVDGNFRFDYDGHIIHYFGRANIMSSADDEIDSLVCAGGPSTLPDSNDYAKSCLTDMSNWDPNQNMMVLMSEKPNEYDQGGSGCPVNAAWGGTVNGGAPGTSPPSCYNGHPPGGFQGILYSTADCLIHQNFQDSGPVICASITLPNESGINPTYYTFPYTGNLTDGQKYGDPTTSSNWTLQTDDGSGG